MNWQEQLITVYIFICKHYERNLWVYCQRMSNFADLSFSDEEVITLYLFGIIDKNTENEQPLSQNRKCHVEEQCQQE